MIATTFCSHAEIHLSFFNRHNLNLLNIFLLLITVFTAIIFILRLI